MNGHTIKAAPPAVTFRATPDQITSMRRLREHGPASERVLLDLVPVASTRAALRDWCLIDQKLVGNALRWVVSPKGEAVLKATQERAK
jgi:hypothetical protein